MTIRSIYIVAQLLVSYNIFETIELKPHILKSKRRLAFSYHP